MGSPAVQYRTSLLLPTLDRLVAIPPSAARNDLHPPSQQFQICNTDGSSRSDLRDPYSLVTTRFPTERLDPKSSLSSARASSFLPLSTDLLKHDSICQSAVPHSELSRRCRCLIGVFPEETLGRHGSELEMAILIRIESAMSRPAFGLAYVPACLL